MTTINQLQSADLRGLKDLYENAFEGSVTDFNKLTRRFREIENNPDYVILCAREEERVVGSVLGMVCQELFGQCNCKSFEGGKQFSFRQNQRNKFSKKTNPFYTFGFQKFKPWMYVLKKAGNQCWRKSLKKIIFLN